MSSEIRSLSAHPILSFPRNHAFTIKTYVSYLEKSLGTSKLFISALEIHQYFITFNCLPFCLLFSKPTFTVSFGKYQLSIILSLITSNKLFLDQEIALTTNEIVDLVCVIVIHVIFSWAQIGRSTIFGREIGIPDREIFSRPKKSSLMSKIVYLQQRRSL